MINETDVSLAKASNAVLIGFNVKANREAKKISEEQKIEIKYFNIIYEALEYIEKTIWFTGARNKRNSSGVCRSSKDFQSFKIWQNCRVKSNRR